MPIKNIAFSFYLVFKDGNDLIAFQAFLEEWSENYRINESILQQSGEEQATFKKFYSISAATGGIIPSDKIIELVKFVSDAGVFRNQEMRLNHISTVSSLIKQIGSTGEN